jgi:hypothetical protein
MTKSLDLACGREPKNTFVTDQVYGADAPQRRNALVELMIEIYRV